MEVIAAETLTAKSLKALKEQVFVIIEKNGLYFELTFDEDSNKIDVNGVHKSPKGTFRTSCPNLAKTVKSVRGIMTYVDQRLQLQGKL